MKTILLLSSIFYILGLKLGHTINFVKAPNPVQKITNTTNAVKSAAKSISFSDESAKVTVIDTLKNENTSGNKERQIKNL